jgi:DNA-binding transcriptional ArsR family regulator
MGSPRIVPHTQTRNGDKVQGDELDGVWKALSDTTRRSILDLLRQGPRTTTQIVEAFPHLSRFGVMKHIDVLREVGLVHTREERRQRINSLNVMPIRQIYERWVGRFEELWASHLLRIKEDAEAKAAEAHMTEAEREPAARSGADAAPPALQQAKKRRRRANR